jgi:2-polyprenyl-3-methyl-5-hydroxy-6-metoxy-1,4-benzoquinol methylase
VGTLGTYLHVVTHLKTARQPLIAIAMSHADQITALYERHAAAWDRDRASRPWNDKPWHDRFIQALPVGATVLDLGCGPGAPVARHMAEHGLKITGVDASPTFIALCRSRLPAQEWMVGDMRSLDLGLRFDGVLAWDSFFHLTDDDQRGMFAVFAAHATPSAVLMFNTGTVHGEAIGNYRGEPLYHASLDTAEYAELLARFGFDLLAHAVQDPQAGGRTVWLARARA